MTSISTSFMRSSLRDMTDITDMSDLFPIAMLKIKSLAGGKILTSVCARLFHRTLTRLAFTDGSAGARVTDQGCVVLVG
jgi:hypothetical protein